MSHFKLFLLLASTVILLSCGNKKKAKIDPPASSDCPETSALIEQLNLLSNDTWEFMDTKAKVTVQSDEMDRTVRASMRFQRDVAMQTNLSFAGLLVAQAKLTNDELLVLNRFQSCYIQSDRSALAQFIDFPVEYKQLQNLMMAKPISHEESRTYVQISDPDYCVLSTKVLRNPEAGAADTNRITATYYFDKKMLKINKIKLESPADAAVIESSYIDFYEEIHGLMLPKETSIVVSSSGKTGKIIIAFGNPQFDIDKPLELNIPEKYERCK
jgi:hypothetical protein